MKQKSQLHPCASTEPNLLFNPLPELSWEPSQARASADKLADYASCEAQLAIQWYLDKKKWKKNWAQGLRVLAILATAAAGAIPVLAQIATENRIPEIAPAWASIALVIAATAVGLDRFFGFSSAWMRFLTTELQIRQALHGFLFDRELQRAKLEGKAPSSEDVQVLIRHCRDFVGQVDAILKDEMDEWVREFRLSLAELDKAAKAQARVMAPGAVNVKVANGHKCKDGWQLSIDAGVPSTRKGKTAAVRGLMPGPHTARVDGSVAGKVLQAEMAFDVAAGRTQEISLTLA